ncbi:hypothetical protein NW752_007598 [Fusarium irregulare]|uniref:Protein kinase domain-containing protein n=1 Tax=Fusarium irregulare TaxID=2494466 RepID=A0A9W8PIY2_9HYPO|nr:hypothetical protein NW766_010106 [Fusarium irregulare]KAJ4013302.1 hypothetical protein NW752_007598 [Fusarium irregulare]
MSDLPESELVDEITLNQVHSGDGTSASIVFKFNDNQIGVSIFPSNGTSTNDTQHLDFEERPLQDQFIDILSRATMCEDYQEFDRLVDEVLDVILDAGRPLFSGQMTVTHHDQSLNRFLFPPTLYFRLEAPGSCASIVPIHPSESSITLYADSKLNENFVEELQVRQDLPRFTPDEVIVTKPFLRGASRITAAVRSRGREMFCKARGGPNGLYGTRVGRELECLGEMLKAFPEPGMIQVPQMIGYVHHKDTGLVLGFLREWVPGCRLSEVDVTTSTPQNRQKWILQISQTIERLHEHGIVWGDGQPNNVVIDDKDDAWLIEFGGATTKGWVDAELADTMDGDKQALGRIIELLCPGEG